MFIYTKIKEKRFETYSLKQKSLSNVVLRLLKYLSNERQLVVHLAFFFQSFQYIDHVIADFFGF